MANSLDHRKRYFFEFKQGCWQNEAEDESCDGDIEIFQVYSFSIHFVTLTSMIYCPRQKPLVLAKSVFKNFLFSVNIFAKHKNFEHMSTSHIKRVDMFEHTRCKILAEPNFQFPLAYSLYMHRYKLR